jgi:hypothetical protein
MEIVDDGYKLSPAAVDKKLHAIAEAFTSGYYEHE